jgi:tRNA1Val (adenine37-N6)-methyltransferase
MKVTTDACLFGSRVAKEIENKIPAATGTAVKTILDIGTGTGLLSLLIAQNNAGSIIDGIEIDKDAGEQAKENIAVSSWSNRITILCGDARQFPFDKKYDVIISNPPFYENELQSENEKKNIAQHSEGLLLDDLLQIIKTNLAGTGIFFLLLPSKRKDEIELLLKKNDLFVLKKILVRQSVNHNYSRIMIAGNMNAGIQTEENEIFIKNNQQQYTPEFVQLLKDYYLHL